MLIIEAKINENIFIVINIYKYNTDSEQLKTFSIMQNILDNKEVSNKQIVFGGDFNLIFDSKLETNGGYPVPKKKPLFHSPFAIFFSFEKGNDSVRGGG